MPRGNGTGPMGMGPMTGRGAGYCAGSGTPGYANPGSEPGLAMGLGRGRGAGRRGFGGGGRGWRNMFRATGLPGWMRSGGSPAPAETPTPPQKPSPESEKQSLQNQIAALQSELALIKNRLAETEAPSLAD
ncbi:MAG: DUF5320 domain-containing protein [Isosphaeraceae bacterium]